MLQKFLNSAELGKILRDLSPLQCLDIGAREQLSDDILPIACATSIYGFEPDKIECERLINVYAVNRNTSPFKKVVFFPVALGRKKEKRTLYITRQRGSSSLLQPIPEVGNSFSRNEYVCVEDTCDVYTLPLDYFLASNAINDVVYMKIDVEGLELEILQSAKNLLSSSLMALRAEVAFLKTRVGQPYYGELETFLRSFDFIPMGFLELHHWRHLTKTKYPKSSNGLIPFSKGQIAHGDMLFIRSLDSLISRSYKECLKAAFLAMNYGYIDYAYYILINNPPLKEYIESKYSISLEKELRTVSLYLRRQYRASKLYNIRGFCKSKFLSAYKLFVTSIKTLYKAL